MLVQYRAYTRRLSLMCILMLACITAHADDKILLLEFGLDDDTLLPNIEQEKLRVASIAPFVGNSLKSLGHEVELHDTTAEMQAQSANGYLVKFPESAVEIAKSKGSRWLAMGELRKFSFMESWLRLYLVDVNSGQVVGHAESEVRGHMTDERMTQRTANSLAQQTDDFIRTLRAKK